MARSGGQGQQMPGYCTLHSPRRERGAGWDVGIVDDPSHRVVHGRQRGRLRVPAAVGGIGRRSGAAGTRGWTAHRASQEGRRVGVLRREINGQRRGTLINARVDRLVEVIVAVVISAVSTRASLQYNRCQRREEIT
jgi:hypothetical protein